MASEKRKDPFFLGNKKDKQWKDDGKRLDKMQRDEQFDENRKGLVKEHTKGETEKKPFDKKTYRLKKYSKKYKLEQWEEQRKKKLLKTYYKDVKNDPPAGSYKPVSFDEDTTDNASGKFVKHPDVIEKELLQNNNRKDPYQKAKEHYNKVKQEKLTKQQERAKAKEERMQKLQEYKKKKQERFKKLSKKTKRGQPVMGGRLEILLDKIQKG